MTGELRSECGSAVLQPLLLPPSAAGPGGSDQVRVSLALIRAVPAGGLEPAQASPHPRWVRLVPGPRTQPRLLKLPAPPAGAVRATKSAAGRCRSAQMGF